MTDLKKCGLNVSSKLEEIHNNDFENKVFELTTGDIKKLCKLKSLFKDADCPACLSRDKAPAYTMIDLDYCRCAKCGTVYVSPCPTEEIIAWYLNKSEGLRYWRENMPCHVIESRKSTLYADRARAVFETAKKYHITPDIVMDVGGGNGELSEALAEYPTVKRVIMVEPQPTNAKIKKVEIIQTTIEKLDLNDKIDVVTAFEVLEHIPHPDLLLKKIKGFLKKDGILVLSTPNIDGFETRILKTLSLACRFDHICLYNIQSISILLKRCGFEVLDVQTPGQLDFQMVYREYAENNIDLSGDPALKYLMENASAHEKKFQEFLRINKLSSHMRCVARMS